MSKIIQLADAVVTQLNAATLSRPFAATRCYQPISDLAQLDSLKVTVVPKSIETSGATRTDSNFDYAIDIAVQQKVNVENSAELDGMMQLAEEIIDTLRRRRLTALPQAACTNIEHNPIFAPEHLEQYRQFTSVMTVTYRMRR